MIETLRITALLLLSTSAFSIFQPPLPPLPIDETVSNEFGFNIDGSPDEQFQLNLPSDDDSAEAVTEPSSIETTITTDSSSTVTSSSTSSASLSTQSSSATSKSSISPPSASPSSSFTLSASSALPTPSSSSTLSTPSFSTQTSSPTPPSASSSVGSTTPSTTSVSLTTVSTTSSSSSNPSTLSTTLESSVATTSLSTTSTSISTTETPDQDLRVTIALPPDALETEAPSRNRFFDSINETTKASSTIATTTTTKAATTKKAQVPKFFSKKAFKMNLKKKTTTPLPETVTETTGTITPSTIAMLRTTLTTRPVKVHTPMPPRVLKVTRLNRTRTQLNVTKSMINTTAEPVAPGHHRRTGRTRRLKLVTFNGTVVRIPSRVHQNPEFSTEVPITVSNSVLASTARSIKMNDQQTSLDSTATFNQSEAFQKSSKFVSGHARAGKKHTNMVKVDEEAKKVNTPNPLRRRLRHSGISHSKIQRISV